MKNNIKPIDAVIAITYMCNSKCTMCDIWKINNHPDIDKNYYKKLPKTLKYINISGGEPFLRSDLVEIIDIILKQCPNSEIIISSNGFAPDLIEQKMKQILKIGKNRIGIGLSIDGIGEMHDTIRGIPGGYKRVLETVDRLQKMGLKNIRFGFTISDKNVSHINKVFDLAKEKGIQFTLTAAQSSEVFFGGKENELNLNGKDFKKEMDILIKKYLKGWNLKKWLRAFFSKGVYNYATDKEMLLPVVSGSKHFFLDPYGKIYPSVVHSNLMGDITKQSFEEIWYGHNAERIREEIRKSKKRVWMVCTARSAILRNPFKVIFWILKNKIK